MLAIYHAAKIALAGHRLHIKTDSKWSINTLYKDLSHLEDTDYVNSPIGNIVKLTVNALRMRPGITTLEWVKGHAGILGNKMAANLANQGANTPTQTHLPPYPYPSHSARLSVLNQSQALKLIN